MRKRVLKNFFHRGFISLAAILISFAILGIVVSLVYRMSQGAVITSKFKSSNQAYQAGDGNAESLLQAFQTIDDGVGSVGGVSAARNIPENILAAPLCSNMGVVCFMKHPSVPDQTIPIQSSTTLREVTAVAGSGAGTLSVARSLKAPVLTRIGLLSSLNAPSSSTVQYSNTNDVVVSWNKVDSADAEAVEIRRATSKNKNKPDGTLCGINCDDNFLGDSSDPLKIISNTNLYWTAIGRVDALTGNAMPGYSGNAVLSGDTFSFIDKDAYNFPPGTFLAYSIKVTNKKPLFLDSPYSTPKTIKIAESAGDTDKKGADAITSFTTDGSLKTGEGESCDTDLGKELNGACQSGIILGANTRYDGYDGVAGVAGSMVFLPSEVRGNRISNQFTCNKGRSCNRCPADGRKPAYAAAEWWGNFTWIPTGTGSNLACTQQCNGGPSFVIRGSITNNCETRSGLERRDLAVAPNTTLATHRLTVDSSKNVTNTPSAGNGYCYVTPASALPDDNTFAQGCVGDGLIKKNGGGPIYDCPSEATGGPYSGYSPNVHPGVRDGRSCESCSAHYGSEWAFSTSGTSSTDKCYQRCIGSGSTCGPAYEETEHCIEHPSGGPYTPPVCVQHPETCTTNNSCPSGTHVISSSYCVNNNDYTGNFHLIPVICGQESCPSDPVCGEDEHLTGSCSVDGDGYAHDNRSCVAD